MGFWIKADPVNYSDLYDALSFLGVVRKKTTGFLTGLSQIRKWFKEVESFEINGLRLMRYEPGWCFIERSVDQKVSQQYDNT